MKKVILITTCIVTSLMLSSCGASKESLAKAQNMTCGELAMKIGQLQQQIKTAKIDGVASDVQGAISKKKSDKTDAAVDGIFSTIEQSTAEKQLEQYMEIYRKKGCK